MCPARAHGLQLEAVSVAACCGQFTLYGSKVEAMLSVSLQVVTCIRLVDELVRAEDPNYKMTPKTEVTSRFYVLPEMIGPAIIGKSGTHAKHIRERTGVRIEVIRECSGHWHRCCCMLSDPVSASSGGWEQVGGSMHMVSP